MSIGRTGPPRRSSKTRSNTPSARASSSRLPAGNDFEDGNPTEVLAEIASRVQGAVSVAAVDRAKNHAFYSSTGSWVEIGRSRRRVSRTSGRRAGRSADRRPETSACASSTPRCLRCHGRPFPRPAFDVFAFLRLSGHVDGHAARRRSRGACSCSRALRVRPPSRPRSSDLRPTSATPGRDNLFGFGLVKRETRCVGWGSRSESSSRAARFGRCRCPAFRSDVARNVAQRPPAVHRPFALVTVQRFAAATTFDATLGSRNSDRSRAGASQVATRRASFCRSRSVTPEQDGPARVRRRNGRDLSIGHPADDHDHASRVISGRVFRSDESRPRTPRHRLHTWAVEWAAYRYDETAESCHERRQRRRRRT